MNRILVIAVALFAMFVLTACKKQAKVEVKAPAKDVPAAVVPAAEVKPVAVTPETKPEPKPAK